MGTLEWIIVALVVLVLSVVLWGYLRLRRLSRQVGVFDCAWRAPSRSRATPWRSTEHWSHGLAEYRTQELVWWRFYSLSATPQERWDRSLFDIAGRVPLDQADLPGLYLVQCRYQGRSFELMMSAEAYHGLSSWTESAPPATQGYAL
ncbi:DUF2550 domain-containing protein [Jonesia quinghaiensis]|uniref:DUF2550 domain-containing protein n=1 Tax=Jonesia quinghaiensis TaxID=262806 RepID=UPI0012F9D08C|nr:DUF2550 domain-containing protein [Jonesia quinghaiensis]